METRLDEDQLVENPLISSVLFDLNDMKSFFFYFSDGTSFTRRHLTGIISFLSSKTLTSPVNKYSDYVKSIICSNN